MRLNLILVGFIILMVLTGCATSKPIPIHRVKMQVVNESYELTYDQLTTGKLALLPCKNNTDHLEITSILDSILTNQLPEVFPELVTIPDSFDSIIEQNKLDSYSLNFINHENFKILDNYILLVEVDSIWKRQDSSVSFMIMPASGLGSGMSPGIINTYSTPEYQTILDVKLSIFAQQQSIPVWERRVQSIIVEKGSISSLLLDNDFEYIAICNQLIEPITTAISILRLPIDLQMELNEINMSKDYKISIGTVLKLYKWIGAEVTKKKFDYKIVYNDRKIYLPLESELLTSQNYNDIFNLLKECNLYYEKIN